MPDYTRNEVVDIIMILGECCGNYCAATRLYCMRFPDVSIQLILWLSGLKGMRDDLV